MSALFLDNAHRELRAAGVFVIAVDGLEWHVAEELVVDPGLDTLNEVLLVDVTVDLRLVVADEGHDVVFLSTDLPGFDSGVPARRRSEKPVRHHPDFKLLRPRRVLVDDDGLGLRLFTDDRLLTAAARRVFSLHAHAVHA